MSRELLVLGLLRQQEMHGYQLHEFIDNNLASCTDIKRPTLYSLLDKLAKQDYIDETEEQEGNRPLRKVYSITPKGEAFFQKLLRQNLTNHDQARFTDDIGLTFIEALPAQEAIELLKKRQVAIREKLIEIEDVLAIHHGGARLVIEHQRLYLSTEIEWISHVISSLA